VANQIAVVLDRVIDRYHEPDSAVPAMRSTIATTRPARSGSSARRPHRLTFYKHDDAIFVDDEYLIRNTPARILWRVVSESQRTGRAEFTNRELRVDS
jgi:adenylate cyclase